MALLREFSKFLVTDRQTHTHTHGTDHSTPAQARGNYAYAYAHVHVRRVVYGIYTQVPEFTLIFHSQSCMYMYMYI